MVPRYSFNITRVYLDVLCFNTLFRTLGHGNCSINVVGRVRLLHFMVNVDLYCCVFLPAWRHAGISRRRVSVCLCVCLSVCLCVCLSQAGIASKRINVGSRTQRHVIPPGTLVFWRQQSFVSDPHSPWNLRSKWLFCDPPPFENNDFDHYPVIAPQPRELA